MYFPKSKIETNLYSDGEFVVKSTAKIYYGPYFKTSNGDYYTGEEPSNSSQTLLPTFETPDALDSSSDYDLRFVGKNYNYSILTNQPITKTKLEPVPYTPQPTKEDYKVGEITRYFAKKCNEDIYYEIDLPSSLNLPNNPLYFIFSIPWRISGPQDFVSTTNQRVVKLIMENLPISNFTLFLKNNYLKFWKPS